MIAKDRLAVGTRVRCTGHPLDRVVSGRVGVLLDYTVNGYARVGLDPKPDDRARTYREAVKEADRIEAIKTRRKLEAK